MPGVYKRGSARAGCVSVPLEIKLSLPPFRRIYIQSTGELVAPSSRRRFRMLPTVPAFDIFSGRFGEKGVVWLGTVQGLGAARDRMLQFAAKQPGAYFVFSSDSQLIVAAVDTSRLMRAS